jgi:hypothetical protein
MYVQAGGESVAKYDLKSRTRFSNSLKNKLYDELKNISDSTEIPISKLFDKSVEFLIESYRREDLLKNEDIDYLDIPIPRNLVNRLRLFAGINKVNFDDYIVSILLDYMIKEDKKLNGIAEKNAKNKS